jgi:hypothetical protein
MTYHQRDTDCIADGMRYSSRMNVGDMELSQ